MITFLLGLITGLALAWLAEWLLDRRHWRRDRATIARPPESSEK